MQKAKRLQRKDYFAKGNHIQIEKRVATSFPLHSHDYFEIEIVAKGKGHQYINSQEYQIQRGSVYILTPADFHEVMIDDGNEIWNIVFDETIFSSDRLCNFLDNKTPYFVVDEQVLNKLENVLILLSMEMQDGGYTAPLIDYLLQLILPKVENTVNDNPIYKAMIYLENNFKDSPSLQETAKQACLSPVYFGTLLKKQTGETYVSYLNSLKIDYARKLLENGFSVTQTCFDSGFGSLSGFLYVFKQKVGITPFEYLKNNSKKDSISINAK